LLDVRDRILEEHVDDHLVYARLGAGHDIFDDLVPGPDEEVTVLPRRASVMPRDSSLDG
jgi:hypothetical protein